jgi:hypothetical protein
MIAYSFATNEMRHLKEIYIGYVEMAIGVGEVAGPTLGGIMYEIVGY